MESKRTKTNLYISPEVREKFPDLQEIMMPVYGVNVKNDENILVAENFEELLGKMSEETFFNQEDFRLLREFTKDLKIDLNKYPPSVEFLYRRYQKTGKVPHVNNVVDCANKVALETLVATGTFDMDQIEGDMMLRFTKEGEEFQPLGGDTEYLRAGLVVIADSQKILNLFPFRDSRYQKITNQTKNVLILADKMPGQDPNKVEGAVLSVGKLIEKHCGGKNGELYVAEETDLLKLSPVIHYEELRSVKEKRMVFSGMRPTGRLHLGNYLGGVKGMLALQEDTHFDTIYAVVDLHATTTPYDKNTLSESARGIIMDYLAAGLDPEKSIIYKQSDLADLLGQLMFYFSTTTTVARMQHLPTFKDKVKQYPENVTMALLNYPVLMAADILIYKAGLVPVGIDQEPHLEVAREIARKMNESYGTDFPEPVRFATKGEYVPSLLGEGKMSKSVEGSYISLNDDLETVRKKVRTIPTSSVVGGEMTPGLTTLFKLAELFLKPNLPYEYEAILANFKSGKLQYMQMKDRLAEVIYDDLKPIQKRRKIYEGDPSLVERILKDGADKAREIANKTVNEVKEKMGLV